MNASMRCFYVLVHGRIGWVGELSLDNGESQVDRPSGFYCHRYVLASGEDKAKVSAIARVRENLEKQTGWISRGYIALDLEAEEVTPAPIHKLLRPDNRGHTFYIEE
jgi:hypothetical protein